MKREELEEIFPCGKIQEELHNSTVMVWGFQLVYAAVAVWGIYRGVLIYRELGTGLNIWFVLAVLVSGYARRCRGVHCHRRDYPTAGAHDCERTDGAIFHTGPVSNLCPLSGHHGLRRRLENIVRPNRNRWYLSSAYWLAIFESSR